MEKLFVAVAFLITTFLFACNSPKHAGGEAALYKSSDFTPVNSFTSGAEGPGVDGDGNLYAVNFS
ncbi:MAG: SMP-30/gluconolactonase/LRE family protein, partial [Ginsengibacter sp.]